MNDQELEIKLLVRDLKSIEERLQSFGAALQQERTHEINLRFDTPGNEFSKSAQAIRLRRDTAARMTYKGPSESRQGVRVRQEIEFVVDDFSAARNFLLALGYVIIIIYEKYRTVYEYNGVLVTLDELPYGYFVEIEGQDPASIMKVNQELGLNWESKIPESYIMMFNRIRQLEKLATRDLLFESINDREMAERVLRLKPADG